MIKGCRSKEMERVKQKKQQMKQLSNQRNKETCINTVVASGFESVTDYCKAQTKKCDTLMHCAHVICQQTFSFSLNKK